MLKSTETFSSRAKGALMELLFTSSLACTRFTLGLAEVLWGISFIWSRGAPHHGAYDYLTYLMPLEYWGVLFLVTGVCQWVVLFMRQYHQTPSVVFSGFNAILWVSVSVAIYSTSYPPQAALSGDLALTFAACWVFIRSGTVIPPSGLPKETRK